MTQPKPQIHMGRGIQHARELRNWTQQGLADMLGPEWNQKRISTLEKRQTVDEPILQKVAQVLGLDPAVLRNYEPQTGLTVNNVFNDHAVANGANGSITNGDSKNIVNDIKEIVVTFQKQTEEMATMYKQQMEEILTMHQRQTAEIKDLYERLLQERGRKGQED